MSQIPFLFFAIIPKISSPRNLPVTNWTLRVETKKKVSVSVSHKVGSIGVRAQHPVSVYTKAETMRLPLPTELSLTAQKYKIHDK